jgi:HEAT repeat protein
MKRPSLLEELAGGDRRSIGRVPLVVRRARRNPALASELVRGLRHDDPLVRMRAADALEKISRDQPAILVPFKTVLLSVAAESAEQEVQWHAAQMLPRLPLTRKDTERAVSILHGYLADRSAIVNVCALQALADLASRDRSLVPMAVVAMEAACRTGTPAMRARGKKLLSIFKNG